MLGFKTTLGRASEFGHALSAMVPLCAPEADRFQQMYAMDSIYLRLDTNLAQVTLWATDFRRMYIYEPRSHWVGLKNPGGVHSIDQWLLPRRMCESLGEVLAALPETHELTLNTWDDKFEFGWGPHKWSVVAKPPTKAMYDHTKSYPTDEPYERSFAVDPVKMHEALKVLRVLNRKSNKVVKITSRGKYLAMSNTAKTTAAVMVTDGPQTAIHMEVSAPYFMDALQDAGRFGEYVRVAVPNNGNKAPYRITPVDQPRAEFLVWPAF